MTKTLINTYLYNKYPDYEKQLYTFIMAGEQIRKKDDAFYDIRYEVKKRQVSNSLITVLDSENVILIMHNRPLPKTLKVFTAKDVKGDKKYKAFIDCSDLISFTNGKYVCNNIEILIAYLVSAMTNLIYYADAKRITDNHAIMESGAACFSKLFTHIIDYIYKISIMGNVKAKCTYLTSMYYMINILEKDSDSTSIKAIARRLSGLSAREEEILEIQMEANTFLNIKFFVESLNSILKINNATLDLIVEKWMYLYGQGTVLSLELFPNFSSMITDAYVGCYINNQKTIEKITGEGMAVYTKTILTIGQEAL